MRYAWAINATKLYLDPIMPLTVKRFMTLKPGVHDKDILPALERVNAAKINRSAYAETFWW